MEINMDYIAEILPIVLVALACILFAFSIRITQEDERFVVLILGRYGGLKGPGMSIKLPGSAPNFTRIALGDRGTFLGDGLVNINGTSFPAFIEYSINSGDSVTIVSFREEEVHVSKT